MAQWRGLSLCSALVLETQYLFCFDKESQEVVHPFAGLRGDFEDSHAGAHATGCFACAARASNSTAAAKSILVMTATSAVLKMVGYFSGLSSPSVDGEEHEAQVFAEVVARRADEVADVLDEEQVEASRVPSRRARVSTIEASRWQTVPVVICRTGAWLLREPRGVVLGREVADERGDAVAPVASSVSTFSRKRRLARAGA